MKHSNIFLQMLICTRISMPIGTTYIGISTVSSFLSLYIYVMHASYRHSSTYRALPVISQSLLMAAQGGCTRL